MLELRMTSQVTSHHEARQHLVLNRVNRVFHDTKHVKTRQNGLCQLDVLLEWDGGIVSPANRVGGSDDCTASLQSRDNTSFRDRDRLLLHGFVDRGSIGVVHLVELVNETSTLIS